MTNQSHKTQASRIREKYREYETVEGIVARIVDPKNEGAWIQSSVTYDLRP